MGPNVREGKSPPAVFISQLGTGGESWQPVIDQLGCGCSAVTSDRPGNGDAPPRPAPNPRLTGRASGPDCRSFGYRCASNRTNVSLAVRQLGGRAAELTGLGPAAASLNRSARRIR
jgi:hypothetical protein